MGIIKSEHGVYIVRKKVPKGLEQAVAQVTGANKLKVSWLKRSLGIKDERQANIRAKPVMIEFDRIIERARASLKPLPLKVSLTDHEIRRIAAYHYASMLAEDEEQRLGEGNRGPSTERVGKPIIRPGRLPLQLRNSGPRDQARITIVRCCHYGTLGGSKSAKLGLSLGLQGHG
jgi:hypothetical protein